MDIKISLKQLNDLFVQSATAFTQIAENEETPKGLRGFAKQTAQLSAQLSVAMVHMARIDAKINAYAKQTDKHIADVASAVGVVNSKIPVAASANGEISVPDDVSEQIASMATGTANANETGTPPPTSFEDEVIAAKEKMEQEAQEEAAALQAKYANSPPPAIVISKKNGEKPTAGGAA